MDAIIIPLFSAEWKVLSAECRDVINHVCTELGVKNHNSLLSTQHSAVINSYQMIDFNTGWPFMVDC
ncbi:hypothetical protein [Dulcicalothrix desertica]|uniref:hypothetical protein n=1 Tax=Dulcicalothrix desertica TaxID=32056 RepID=UPI000F8E8C20|nr:hypothetical protein [Dulcicalothrix desertica]